MRTQQFRLQNLQSLSVILLLTGLLLVSVNTLYIYTVGPHADFISFWSAGRWLIEGRNPYSLGFMYPGWVALLLIPLGSLPFLPAAVTWLTLNELLFIGAILFSIWLSRVSLHGAEKVILTLGMVLLIPTLFAFFHQQSSIIILFLLVVASFAWQQNFPVISGAIMALALSKPHLTFFIVLYWLISAIVRGEWRLLIGFSATLTTLLTLAQLVQPGWLSTWFIIWQNELAVWLAKYDFSLLQSATTIPILIFIGLTLAVVVALFLALLSLYTDRRFPHPFGLTWAIPLTLMLSFRPGSYDLVLLTAPLILLITRRQPSIRLACLGGAIAFTLGLTLAASYFHNWLIMQSLSAWVLLAALTLERQHWQCALIQLVSLLKRPPQTWPKPYQQALLRLLVISGIISIGYHLTWWQGTEQFKTFLFLGLLSATLIVNLLQIICIWYLYLHIDVPHPSPPKPGLTVDVFITSFHEPLALIERALKAALNMHYPHRTYLLDDGHDPECCTLAERLGVTYLTRPNNRDAKAGNVNHALTQTQGEFVTIFDIDHAPQPEFLDRVLGYFRDPQIGCVQVMLSHCNQGESFVAQAAAEQTYDAFGPTFMGMHGCDGATVIGSNCTFRRTALEDIGGYKPGLAEDLHTSIHIHARGWRSIYVPEVLAYGLVPSDLSAFFKQQFKWARGVFEVLLEKYTLLAQRLAFQQHVCYFTRMTYYLAGPIVAINQLFLILYLLFGSAIARADFARYLWHWLPFMAIMFLTRQFALACWQPDPASRGLHGRGMLLVFGAWPIYTLAFICALLRIKIPFIATPKERQGGNYLGLILPQIIAIILLLFSAGWRIIQGANTSDWVMIAFAWLNILLHSGVFYAVWEGYRIHANETRQPLSTGS